MSGNFDFGDVKIEMGSGGEGQVQRDAPFHIGVLGDFQGAADGDASDRLQRGLIEVDRDNLAEIFQRMSVCWRGQPSRHLPEVTIQFQSIDDFDPDALFKRLDIFAELRDLRKRLNQDSTYAEAAEIVEAWDAASPAGDAPARRDPGPRILVARVLVPRGLVLRTSPRMPRPTRLRKPATMTREPAACWTKPWRRRSRPAGTPIYRRPCKTSFVIRSPNMPNRLPTNENRLYCNESTAKSKPPFVTSFTTRSFNDWKLSGVAWK